MAKTYLLKALWPLLPFEVAPAPLQATLDAYGGGLVKYAVNPDGIWLYSLAQPLTASESENLTGFHPADLVPKQIDGVEGYSYALLGGAPLLPITAVHSPQYNGSVNSRRTKVKRSSRIHDTIVHGPTNEHSGAHFGHPR